MKNLLENIELLKNDLTNLSNLIENKFTGLDIKGVYAIWWTGDTKKLIDLNREVCYQGKPITKKEKNNNPQLMGSYHIHTKTWDWNLDSNTCLYVGKAHSIANRLKQRLFLSQEGGEEWYSSHKVIRNGTKKEINPFKGANFIVKRNSGCQFRAGMEHLYKKHLSTPLKEKLLNFSISYRGEEDFKERFYLEDLAIGYFRPWFNLDSER